MITLVPADGDLPPICIPSLNPEKSHPPLDMALFSCIAGQDSGSAHALSVVPLSNLFRGGYVAALRFERYLLIRLPRLEVGGGKLSRRFRIFLERAFAISFHCREKWDKHFMRSS